MQLLGACLEPEVLIVSEKLDMDLMVYFHTPEFAALDMAHRVKMGKDIARGLSWLHGMNIVHRDVKLANILVSLV